MNHRHDIAHPPTPIGATKRESQTIAALHRQATMIDDQPAASTMLDGVGLIVELIQARGKRLDFESQWDHNQAERWAE